MIRERCGGLPIAPSQPVPATDDPTVTMREFLHGDRWTMPSEGAFRCMDVAVPLRKPPKYEGMLPQIVEMAEEGSGVDLISRALGIGAEVVRDALHLHRTGDLPATPTRPRVPCRPIAHGERLGPHAQQRPARHPGGVPRQPVGHHRLVHRLTGDLKVGQHPAAAVASLHDRAHCLALGNLGQKSRATERMMTTTFIAEKEAQTIGKPRHRVSLSKVDRRLAV